MNKLLKRIRTAFDHFADANDVFTDTGPACERPLVINTSHLDAFRR